MAPLKQRNDNDLLEQTANFFFHLSKQARGDIYVAPLKANGSPDWARAADGEYADWRPTDEAEAARWCVVVDCINGCDPKTKVVIYQGEGSTHHMIAVGGDKASQDRARNLIHRDLTGFDLPANDNAPDGLPVVDPTAWEGQSVPERTWFIEGWIPNRVVTLLSGDGGLGKSLAALQLSLAAVLDDETMGVRPKWCRALYVGAEDETEEFQRRIADILKAHDARFSDLNGNFLLVPLADRDALLASPDRAGNMQPTPLLQKLIARIGEFQPGIIVLDTSADLFGGDEIKRSQVRQFVGMLRQIAIKMDCAVLLLSHPSVAGMQSGTGTSGSTAWSNSVRSRLYLTAAENKRDEPEDPDGRVLTKMKANYGRPGEKMQLRWQDGIFVRDDGDKPNPAAAILAKADDETFVALLSQMNRAGQRVGPSPSSIYAPTLMARHPDAKGASKARLERAMGRLLSDGTVKIVEEGPASKRRQRLWLASEDFGGT